MTTPPTAAAGSPAMTSSADSPLNPAGPASPAVSTIDSVAAHSTSTTLDSTVVRTLTLPEDVAPVTLLGARDEVLRAIEKGFTDVDIHVRGTAVTVSGPAARVDTVVVLLSELIDVARTGTPLTADAVERVRACSRLSASNAFRTAAQSHSSRYRGAATMASVARRPPNAKDRRYGSEVVTTALRSPVTTTPPASHFLIACFAAAEQWGNPSRSGRSHWNAPHRPASVCHFP